MTTTATRLLASFLCLQSLLALNLADSRIIFPGELEEEGRNVGRAGGAGVVFGPRSGRFSSEEESGENGTGLFFFSSSKSQEENDGGRRRNRRRNKNKNRGKGVNSGNEVEEDDPTTVKPTQVEKSMIQQTQQSFCDDELYYSGDDFCEDPVEYPQHLVDQLLDNMEMGGSGTEGGMLQAFFEGGGPSRQQTNKRRRKKPSGSRSSAKPRLPTPVRKEVPAVPIVLSDVDEYSYEQADPLVFALDPDQDDDVVGEEEDDEALDDDVDDIAVRGGFGDTVEYGDDDDDDDDTEEELGARSSAASPPFPSSSTAGEWDEWDSSDTESGTSNSTMAFNATTTTTTTTENGFMSTTEGPFTTTAFPSQGGQLQETFVQETPLCRSTVSKIYPKRALNKENNFRFILNSMERAYIQSVRIEKCTLPGDSCELQGGLRFSDFGIRTVCRQKYTYRTMLAINEDGHEEVDLFKFPSCCVCHQVEETPFSSGNAPFQSPSRPLTDALSAGASSGQRAGRLLSSSVVSSSEESSEEK